MPMACGMLMLCKGFFLPVIETNISVASLSLASSAGLQWHNRKEQRRKLFEIMSAIQN